MDGWIKPIIINFKCGINGIKVNGGHLLHWSMGSGDYLIKQQMLLMQRVIVWRIQLGEQRIWGSEAEVYEEKLQEIQAALMNTTDVISI